MLNIIPSPLKITLNNGFFTAKDDYAAAVVRDASLAHEEYLLTVSPEKVEITCSDGAGEFYARQTLSQLEYCGKLPCCTIADKPRFSHRSFMVDSARHMQTVDELKKYIDAAALLKFNVFHWHLSDDQGWRFECESYPELTKTGAYRKSSDFGKTHINETYGGYYTKAQMKEIVDYCKARFIDIVPEIDMPGHMSAALASYNILSCRNEPVEVVTKQGIYKNILCCGKETTFDFVFAVLDEVMEVFPFEYIHIGGDEAPKNRWDKCPYCQRRMRDLRLENSEQLQGWFTNRVAEYLKKHGRKAIAWNESLKSGMLDGDVTVQNWMDKDSLCPHWVNNGGKMIVSDFYNYYLDYPYGMTPLKKTLAYNPVVKGVNAQGEQNIIGVEAPIWTEYIDNFERLCYQCFPRLAAVAQTAWSQSPADEKTFEDNFKSLTVRLEGLGITPAPQEEWNPSPLKKLSTVVNFFSGTLSKEMIHDFFFSSED